MRAQVIVNGQGIGYTVSNGGLFDAEINGKRIALSYMNRGAATMWVKRNAPKPAPAAASAVTSTVRTANTRPHQVRPVGRQHADDQAPMGQCTVCDALGEWNALNILAPNAYGCAGRPPYDED